ncbi:ESX secretion-associated protein EspG [Actinokineospora guangxiensis]|uniref:ESX secretion-associated protein EspG n=1 Tax=Actinokineospora guangxiensis TaxID=1490288 RepID=A0ABW0ESA9_9PSEU
MPITTPVQLPKVAFHAAWALAGGGEPHPVIGADQHYLADGVRRDLLAETRDLLRDLGWLRGDRPDARFLDLLTLLTWADRQCYAWTSTVSGGDAAILVAALGRDAVRVLVDQQQVLLAPGRTRGLAAQLVEMLPRAAPARVPVLTPTTARPEPDDEDDPLGGVSAPPPDRFQQLASAPRDGVCQLYTAARERRGPLVRSGPHSVIDVTGVGRVLVTAAGGRTTLRSGTDQAIVELLDGEQRRVAGR